MTWQGTNRTSLESVRLFVSDGRLRASGRLIVASETPYSASFEFTAARKGDVGRGLLRTTAADTERSVSVGRTEDGIWLIDDGNGATARNEFEGAVDVDVAGSVTFTALPIRRLGLHRRAGEVELPVLYVSMPDLAVKLVRQTYRTVEITDDGAVINYTDAHRSADIVVDKDGLPVTYPDVAQRL
ncbi:putative glycolipid-binding domain-containing protein [Actinophytocola sp. NPDC049390]|uniref:putative glycolipid-binding domain-containing protein n=1 Tax=Actinophytocola sp. NPDC049390 TaxID=3363894 RepID=UPI0037971332